MANCSGSSMREYGAYRILAMVGLVCRYPGEPGSAAADTVCNGDGVRRLRQSEPKLDLPCTGRDRGASYPSSSLHVEEYGAWPLLQ